MTWTCGGCGRDNPPADGFCGGCGSRAPLATTAAPPQERRLITALFADISGFTELADSLDAEEVHEIIAPLIKRLAQVAERFGGTVAKYAGDALLVFFGAPIAFEDHAARALTVALEMHRECAAVLPELPSRGANLSLHIGVNTGSVVSGLFGGDLAADYSILGDAVNVSQRLESLAPSGETYVGAPTVQLAESRFVFEPLENLRLKGKSDPVVAFRLVGSSEPSAPSASATGLVGRESEMRQIEQALQSGESRRVCIVGDAGVGKSAIINALARKHKSWLQVRCDPYAMAIAYRPFARLVRRALRLPDQVTLTDLDRATEGRGIPHAAPVFARLLGIEDERAPQDPQVYQLALHRAFSDWLTATSPVVLSVEDLHWADDASAALLDELCRVPGVHTVVTTRSDGARSIKRICSNPLELKTLAGSAVRELIQRLLEGSPPAGFSETIADRTDGNPLFVEEIVRTLRESGKIFKRSGRWHLAPDWDAEAVPPTIEGVIGARIDAQSRDAQRLLGAASVIGRLVSIPLLMEVAQEIPDIRGALIRLEQAGFIDQVPGMAEETYLLHHALVQEVAYSRMLRRTRSELHLRTARAIESLYGVTDETIDALARNYYLGGAREGAFEYLKRAAERARRLHANDASIKHLERAIEVAPLSEKPSIELILADMYELAGRYESAFEMYRNVRDSRGDVRAWQGMISTLRKRGDYEAALALVNEALDSVAPDRETRVAFLLERAWTYAVEGDFRSALDAASEGLASCTAKNPTRGNLLIQVARATQTLGRPEEALQYATAALDLFDTLGDLRGQSTALRLIGPIYMAIGDLSAAKTHLTRGLETARKIGNVEEIGGCLINLGLLAEAQRDFQAAASLAREATNEFERIDHLAGRATGFANLSTALLKLDENEEALLAAGQALKLARQIHNTPLIADSLQTIAEIRKRFGDRAGATSAAREAASLWESIGVTERADECRKLIAKSSDTPDANESSNLEEH